jgi:hypothetical protein
MDPLRTVAQNHIRFGIKSNDSVVAKTLNGIAKKWVRMRVVETLDVVPRSEYVTGHVNCVKFGSDGACEYFGMSRPVKKLPLGNLIASGATSDQVLYADMVLSTTRTRLLPGGGAFVTMQTVLPTNTDVSFPMKVVVQAVGSPGVSACTGNATLVCSWLHIASGDVIYTSATTVTKHDSITVSQSITSNVAYEFTFVVPIADINVNPSNGQISTLWLQIERPVDTYAQDISIVTVFGLYVSTADGAHLLSY